MSELRKGQPTDNLPTTQAIEPIYPKVVAICSSPNHGYPTHPYDSNESVTITPQGVYGDAHSSLMRESFTKPGTFKPNDRPISIVSQEMYDEMNGLFGLDMSPGDFNEQLVVQGLGDLSDVAIGDHILFANAVELEVTDNAMPCTKLTDYHGEPGLLKALVSKDDEGKIRSKRGILTRVVTPGQLETGTVVNLWRASNLEESSSVA